MSHAYSSSSSVGSVVPLIAVLALASCAPLPESPSATPTADARRRSSVITQDEIDRASERGSYPSVFELIAAVRPSWFQHRGQGSMTLNEPLPDVYVDGMRFPGTAMREIALSQASRLEFLTASEATIRFGTQEGVGAVLVTTRRGR